VEWCVTGFVSEGVLAEQSGADFTRVNRFFDALRREDDRGFILSIAAFAEELLGQLLLVYLTPGKHSTDLVEGFNAPLGTLSSRIKVCHAIGLLSAAQYADLDIIRRVRNEFAHNWEGCSFEDQKIAALVERLLPGRIVTEKPTRHRDKVNASATSIMVELEVLKGQLIGEKRRAPSVAMHLSTKPYVPPRRKTKPKA
jgi:hypothetical protein